MLRTLRTPLLRTRLVNIPRTFCRPLAVASTESFRDPSLSPKATAIATFLEDEPTKPNILTDIPGPKVRAAKEAMGKIQDVHTLLK
jgi:hypothetical protein